jgi:hypothetical protein
MGILKGQLNRSHLRPVGFPIRRKQRCHFLESLGGGSGEAIGHLRQWVVSPGGAVTNTAVPVSDGLFTVQVDFGSTIFKRNR